jgi:hypothetical protein
MGMPGALGSRFDDAPGAFGSRFVGTPGSLDSSPFVVETSGPAGGSAFGSWS